MKVVVTGAAGVAATRAAADSGRPGCVYNAGGGKRVSINDVLALVAWTRG